ncbi:MAG: hypothetical protein NTV86_00120 [Planctomycetota bacterium]|nr:hypothetical protein [Planctomycetota bacterium]
MLLPAQTRVLYNQEAPGTFLENTAANREEFGKKGFAWTQSALASILLPSPPPESLKQALATARSIRSRFYAAVSRNLQDARRSPFPDLGAPLWLSLLPWVPKISRVSEIGDLSEAASQMVRRAYGLPEGIEVPQEWLDVAAGTNLVKVYELSTRGAMVHVVVAFLTQPTVRRGQDPAIGPVSQETVDALYAEYVRWRGEAGHPMPAYTYLAMASARPWPEGVRSARGGDHLTVLSGFAPREDEWELRMPEQTTLHSAMRVFLDRLRPETRDDRARKLKAIIDDELYSGNPVHLKWLYEKMNGTYCRESIQTTMFDLQETGDYQLYRTNRGLLAIANLAITPPEKVRGPGVTAGTLKARGLTRYLLIMLTPTVGVFLWTIRDWILGKTFNFWMVLILLVFAYLGEILDRFLQRYAESKE